MKDPKYSVLRQDAEGAGDLKIVGSEFATRGKALAAAKKYSAAQIEAHGSWADRFYVALLEEV